MEVANCSLVSEEGTIYFHTPAPQNSHSSWRDSLSWVLKFISATETALLQLSSIALFLGRSLVTVLNLIEWMLHHTLKDFSWLGVWIISGLPGFNFCNYVSWLRGWVHLLENRSCGLDSIVFACLRCKNDCLFSVASFPCNNLVPVRSLVLTCKYATPCS